MTDRRRHVLLAAVGSRGDIQPFIHLGLALVAAGCRVTVAVEARLLPVVAEHPGLETAMIYGDMCGAQFSADVLDVLKNTKFPALRMAYFMAAWERKAAPSLVVASLEAALAGVDVVVAHPLLGAATAALCEARGIPWVLALLLPVFQTASFPDVVVCGGGAALACLNSPRLNCASYALLGLIFWRSQRTWAAPLRIRLGLPPAGWLGPCGSSHLASLGVPVLMATSLCMVPGNERPADWPPNVVVTGFLTLPRVSRPLQRLHPALAAFVAAADPLRRPLVVIGFGSMPFPGGKTALVRLAADAAAAGALRVLLLTGWTTAVGDDDGDDDDCTQAIAAAGAGTLFVARSAPHDALLPRVSAVAHHGGAGTCGACLAAGVPQVPCPLFVDQPHNAACLVALGVAPCSLPLGRLCGASLGAALSSAARDGRYAEAARAAAAAVAAESAGGMKTAVEAVVTARMPHAWAARLRGGGCVAGDGATAAAAGKWRRRGGARPSERGVVTEAVAAAAVAAAGAVMVAVFVLTARSYDQR